MIKFLIMMLVLAPAVVAAAYAEQRGGTVTEDYFGEPVIYTNSTNRTLTVEIKTHDIENDLFGKMEIDGLKDLTVWVRGNVFSVKQVYPIGSLVDDFNATIPLTDGRIDSYRVCIYFLNYDAQAVCSGMNEHHGVTFEEFDVTDILRKVWDDVKEENEERDEDDELLQLSTIS